MTTTEFASRCAEASLLRQNIMLYLDWLLRHISTHAVINRLNAVGQKLCTGLLLCVDRTGRDRLAITQEFIAGMPGERCEPLPHPQRELGMAGLSRQSGGR